MLIAAAETNPFPPARWLQELPPARRERLSPAMPPIKHRAVLSAYALARKLVIKAAGTELWNSLAFTDEGKPHFPAYPSLQISLSHTRGYVLCALSDTAIGCDTEMLRGIAPALGRKLLGSGYRPEDNEAAIRRFCLLEARFKRWGIPLWQPSPEPDGALYRLDNAIACVSAAQTPQPLPLYNADLTLWTPIDESEGKL